jgi:hypothetical protein
MSQRVLLMSVMAAMIVLPAIAARDPSPARGLRRGRIAVAVFVVLWAYSLLVVLPLLKE